MEVKRSSPNDTPKEETLFIVEYPSVSTVKYQYKDIDALIGEMEFQEEEFSKKKKELLEIKKEMDKLLK